MRTHGSQSQIRTRVRAWSLLRFWQKSLSLLNQQEMPGETEEAFRGLSPLRQESRRSTQARCALSAATDCPAPGHLWEASKPHFPSSQPHFQVCTSTSRWVTLPGGHHPELKNHSSRHYHNIYCYKKTSISFYFVTETIPLQDHKNKSLLEGHTVFSPSIQGSCAMKKGLLKTG